MANGSSDTGLNDPPLIILNGFGKENVPSLFDQSLYFLFELYPPAWLKSDLSEGKSKINYWIFPMKSSISFFRHLLWICWIDPFRKYLINE